MVYMTVALSSAGTMFLCFVAQIRIFAREEAIDAGHGKYALNITGKILKFFENYYNVSYPLSKSGEKLRPAVNLSVN